MRLRMSERGYDLANINIISRIDGTKSDKVGRAPLMETCNAARQVITCRLGEGTVTSEVVNRQARADDEDVDDAGQEHRSHGGLSGAAGSGLWRGDGRLRAGAGEGAQGLI